MLNTRINLARRSTLKWGRLVIFAYLELSKQNTQRIYACCNLIESIRLSNSDTDIDELQQHGKSVVHINYVMVSWHRDSRAWCFRLSSTIWFFGFYMEIDTCRLSLMNSMPVNGNFNNLPCTACWSQSFQFPSLCLCLSFQRLVCRLAGTFFINLPIRLRRKRYIEKEREMVLTARRGWE